eukprot:TRINITY_DN54501_c0_g1_i1.p1 TRINITY_DN54501_c0_g1~~TRINITY_DN54501_c0_g1_i1.p1  ORF type:complete len:747 (+),score=107.55 TRINITY_DN54501_c0_g1_i1:50-2290(+)
MAALPAGSFSTSCLPRAGATWALPTLLVPLGQARNTYGIYVASAVASALEGGLWVFHRNKNMRAKCNPTRIVPFPLRICFLVIVQILLLCFGGSGNDQVGSRSTPKNAVISPQASSLLQTDFSERQPAIQELPEEPSNEPVFAVDADPATLTWEPKTISVILPCAEERDFAVKTVKSVFDNTPSNVLKEIVVVDDGSEPPLSKTHMDSMFQKKYKVRLERHETTVGLIGAKKTGGDVATGDVLVFFDCHVAPQPHWHESFLTLIAENYRRMIVPQITDLDIDTWTQRGSGGGTAKCYLTWDADFKWTQSDDMYVAVISGGLLGLSQRWWSESGGYDRKMLGWGGENLDQSLRMWLCGGEIVNAADSYVAHMWRVRKDKRTAKKYKSVGDAVTNRARAIYAWYGDFTQKLQHFPAFSTRKSSAGQLPWYGDLSELNAIRDNLHCRPFAWFLRRFKGIYEDGGLLPPDIFMLRDTSTGKCLDYSGEAGTAPSGEGGVALVDCDGARQQMFWHGGNAGREGNCCSGFRVWNTDQCMSTVDSNDVATRICDMTGKNSQQHWTLDPTGQLRQRNSCLVVQSSGDVKSGDCVGGNLRATGWEKYMASEPLETMLYKQARKNQPEVFTAVDLMFSGNTQSNAQRLCDKMGGCFALVLEVGTSSEKQCLNDLGKLGALSNCGTFFYTEKTLRTTVHSDSCVDMMNDNDPLTWGIYNCHGGDVQFFNRIPASGANTERFCNVNHAVECLTVESLR